MNDALPDDGTGLVFAGYAIVFLLLLIYIWILGAKYQRLSRELTRLNEDLERAPADTPAERPTERSGV